MISAMALTRTSIRRRNRKYRRVSARRSGRACPTAVRHVACFKLRTPVAEEDGDDGDRRIFLQTDHETTAFAVEFGPEDEIVVAEIEDISRPRFDRHLRFGDGDVVSVPRGQLVEDWN